MSRSVLVLVGWLFSWSLCAAEPAIPHAQDKPPNEPRDAATAATMMTVPPGFVVDVVANEPDIVNPVAMAIDEKGRFWITESLEYPRRSAGPGQDRVKILEDTDGDGQADKFSIFLDGLNIPSGVQVGHGGVWIVNAPDILFVPDANRDGVADGPAQVVVTGFGRTDTHELPNSLTWGPDGWLYGLNGVFNHSHVKYSETNPNYAAAGGKDQKGWPLTCAMFRIHPRTWEFEVFCEGTSNPWGIAFNDEGDAFVSACVIDHLWHLVETGYYHRQGGPYPPHTWKMDSIVKHKHQKAAYCGITWFDSDAYPEQYRRKLYMGNIHGGCINVDRIERNGSTYAGFGEPDFLTANDSWFMPVVQKTGPDGCLYILDWYDRYHCYQDANRDPAGIDRLKGRLYRVRYTGDTKAPATTAVKRPLDLAALPDDELIALLGHSNIWMRETAQRILQERNSAAVIEQLKQHFHPGQKAVSKTALTHMVFTVLGCDLVKHEAGWDISERLLKMDAPFFRAWAARSVGLHELRTKNAGQLEQMHAAGTLFAALEDGSPEVRLQGTIAIGRFAERSAHYVNYVEALARSVLASPEDLHYSRIVWQALKPLMEDHPQVANEFLLAPGLQSSTAGKELQSRIVDWMLSGQHMDTKTIGTLLISLEKNQSEITRILLNALTTQVQVGELKGPPLEELKATFGQQLQSMVTAGSPHPFHVEAVLLASSWGDSTAIDFAAKIVESNQFSEQQRLTAANALIASRQLLVLDSLTHLFEQPLSASNEFRSKLLASLARYDHPRVADIVLALYSRMDVDLQPRAIELLTQRPVWAKSLLTAMGDQKIPASVLNVNQARRLAESKDEAVRELLARHWGLVREGRSHDRDHVIAEMRTLIRKTPGDAFAGERAFKKVCAQCHKIYGEGAEVGPDITLNGRNDFTQLLSNVFDPSLVIGSGYRSYTVATDDGRVLNGLLVEESPQRVILKVQGGKQEVIARDDIDILKVNEISLMPEQLERQLSPQEIADLFAFLTLDKHPNDPTAKRLAGVYSVASRASTNPADFANIVQEVAPGFTEVRSGEGGVALLAEYRGRTGVVRTHPISRDQPGVLIREVTLPADKKAKLIVDVSHDPRGDWRLVATAGSGGRIIDELVGPKTCPDGWGRFSASLEKFAGQTVKITLYNQANDWAWEFAYWGAVTIEIE